MRIAVIQLARLGDVLQTLPAIQGLKRKYPGSEVTLIARSAFADAARLSPHVDRLAEFPTKTVLGPYFERPSAETKAIALATLIQWLSLPALKQEYDLLINLTYSRSSSLLAQLIPAKKRVGMHRSRDGEIALKDAWSQYFVAQVLGKNHNILHLNDLFARICGARDGSHPAQLKPIAAPTGVPGPQHGTRYIGLQIAASVEEKTLPTEGWRVLCGKIHEEFPHCALVFFGSARDRARIDAIAPENSINLAGSMRFHENVRWVRACEHVISPDTAMVHLASLAGTKVINISLGGVRPEETGPYGEGHSVLRPLGASEQEIAEAVCAVLKGRRPGNKVLHSLTSLKACSDRTVRSELVPSNHAADEIRFFFERAYYLLAEFRCSGLIEDLPVPSVGRSGQAAGVDKLLHAFDAMCALKKIGKMGQRFSVDLLLHANDKRSLRRLTRDLSELDRLLAELHRSCEFTRPLIDWVRVCKDLVDCSENANDRLQELASAQEAAYRELEQNIDILEQLLQTSLAAAQEKAAAAGAPKPGFPSERRRTLDAE